MKVYFIRHGQTTSNRDGLHQGWSEVGLSDLGIAQAKELGKFLKDKKFGKICASDLTRAKQTANIVFENKNIEYSDKIREINNTVISGQRVKDLAEKHGEQHYENIRSFDYSAYGGESSADFLNRVSQFMKELEKLSENKNINDVAVVAHGGVIHALASYVLGIRLYSELMQVDNCSVNVVEFKNDNWKIVKWNYTNEL